MTIQMLYDWTVEHGATSKKITAYGRDFHSLANLKKINAVKLW